MSFSDNKQFWTEFIELYRDQRSLWDVKSTNYCNTHIRKECYAVLIEKAKELVPESDKKFVKAKIESLRASFRRESKKKEQSKNKSGSGRDDVYEPTLWYYNLMSFTSDQGIVRKCLSSLGNRSRVESSQRNIDEDDGESEDTQLQNEDVNESHDAFSVFEDAITSPVTSRPDSAFSDLPATSTPASRTSSQCKKRKSVTDVGKKKENFLDAATSVLTQNNKFRAFGNSVSFQLEDMDRRQRVIAEKLISHVLFHGKLGNLKDYSAMVVEYKNQQPNNPTHNNQRTNSNFMNEHAQSQPYRPGLFYNRTQFDFDHSYVHNCDGTNYFPRPNYNKTPLQYQSQEIATVSTLQPSAAVTSAQISIPVTAHTHASEAATALKSNTSGIHSAVFQTNTSSTSGEGNDNQGIRKELGQFVLLHHGEVLINE